MEQEYPVGDIHHFDMLNLPHRFHDFTPDFAVWAVFYGPEGGEKP